MNGAVGANRSHWPEGQVQKEQGSSHEPQRWWDKHLSGAGEEPSFILAREHAHSQQHSQTPLTLDPSPRLGGAREGARSRRWYSRVQAHGKRSLLPRLPPGEGSLRTATTLPASWRNGHCGFKRITRALVRISPNRIHLIMPAIHYSTVVMR